MFTQHISYGLLLGLFFIGNLPAQTFQSRSHQTQLLELYSSQGCSSCPPAERWITKQLQHPGLWTQFIPVVFHVDYWNYLGWKDPFSNTAFSQRQRLYHSQGATGTVYTPGVIFNGKEWRGWYQKKPLPIDINKPGILSAELINHNLQVNYATEKSLLLNVALLGFGIKTEILNGENEGQIFEENFIVLNKQTALSKNGQWNIEVITNSIFEAQRYALAIWINTPDNLQPLQATGGWIKQQPVSENKFNP